MSSNDLTQVRDYINTRMPLVDSDFKEWTDSLEDVGNIPKSVLDNSYHITLGTSSASSQNSNHIEEDFGVIVTIFKRGFREPVVARDTVLQKANCVRLDVIDPLNVESYKAANDGNIEEVRSVSLTTSEIDVSNDNVIKVEIELNVRLFFGIT